MLATFLPIIHHFVLSLFRSLSSFADYVHHLYVPHVYVCAQEVGRCGIKVLPCKLEHVRPIGLVTAAIECRKELPRSQRPQDSLASKNRS